MSLFLLFHKGQAWFRWQMPSEQSLLWTSGARALFWAFNDSSRARLYLDVAKEVGDISAAAETERRSQHEECRLHSATICHDRFMESMEKTNHKPMVSRNTNKLSEILADTRRTKFRILSSKSPKLFFSVQDALSKILTDTRRTVWNSVR